ncbi:MAG: excinuclease ABC subunit UvrC [Eubacteriales bacterium]|nr:excinuclease ABC subunit UvrC [Eubacteriales bacterium]
MLDLEERLKKIPDLPGVYLHKDELGQIIYVGKAISLKNRVRQYFRKQKNMDPKVKAMVGHIADFEYITCKTELEALILECNLIKKYMPRYNVLLRDDKTYPYIKVTTNEQYPRIIKTRKTERDGGRYFGPYSDAGAVNTVIDLLNDTYSLKRCATKSFTKDARPCLNYHIDKCTAICTNEMSQEEYAKKLSPAIKFLEGKRKPLLDELAAAMNAAVERLDFEEASVLRDRIKAAEAVSEIQRVAVAGAGDMDLVLAVRTANENYAVIFSVRSGKLLERETFRMHVNEVDNKEDIVTNFLMQHYSEAADDIVPPVIIVESLPKDSKLIEQSLSAISGKKISVVVPKKGVRKAFLDLARSDIRQMYDVIDEKARNEKKRISALNDELCKIMSEAGYIEPPDKELYRVEAYDISNLSGIDTVAAMVVFLGTQRARKEYRRFRVKSVEGPDDYTSLKEVIYRRFRRAEKGDESFSNMPDILFIDGGKGQVSAVSQVLSAMKIQIPIFGMMKDKHHRTRALIYSVGDAFVEIDLKDRPLLFKYVGNIQEEVHRFAIEYHRKLRDKRMKISELDNIGGIGPAKRNALLAHFGSIDAVKQADISNLRDVPGITEAIAAKIREYFNC